MAAKEFIDKHGNKGMHGATLLAVVSMLGLDMSGSSFGLARKGDIEAVDNRLTEHEAVAELELTSVADELKRIRAYTEVVPELRDLLKLRCMGTQNLDTTIDRLKREFRELTGEDYIEPSCERLLASP